ncbi:formylglycine-generating enzyme family protein [Pectobacterium polaris]|uniref:Formylglycine-generating enzyme family protein n=1 Tax=Pectobacterium polaris TaxID=2042057 RepID=A0AAW5G9G7_9GAMM|nr:formylglycine-generating enzyme family protein [Pectobacterium polaris]MCL6349974.1 formylglycine-generating enzyme family protein [Pectobacterium polaris]MCL6367372.1 formylglycine-generating enzyme family protein [Pectobacterium polaris]
MMMKRKAAISLMTLFSLGLPASQTSAQTTLSEGSRLDAGAHTTTGKTYTNSLGMRFVAIPAGNYLMGSAESEADSREKPQHKVTISRSFLIGQFEVTQADWLAVMGEDAFARDRSNPYYRLPGMAARITHPNHPATVSWQDAMEFIAKLNQREGENSYRLPTEAEWEYVARAGTASRYFFGNDATLLNDYAWNGGDFVSGGTHPVGMKKPNQWGVYDIYGNAWEWVSDYYSNDYYSQSPVIDPQGPDHGSSRVVRGGSWHSTADGWHSAWRKPYSEDYRGISIGFRLVLTRTLEEMNKEGK